MHRCFTCCVCAILVLLLPRSSAADVSDFLAGTLTESGTGLQLPYRLYVPSGYDAAKEYPLVLFLHGSGESGTDNTSQVNSNINNLLSHVKTTQYSSFLLAPQTDSGWAWYDDSPSDAIRMTLSVISLLETQYNIDADRLYITGLSMGGFGTWETIWQNPGLFAAAVPICGGGQTSKAPLMVDEPIWNFHNSGDTTVSVTYSREMIAAVQAAGGRPLYTEYQTSGHNAWSAAYNESAMYNWMFSQNLLATPHDIYWTGSGNRVWTPDTQSTKNWAHVVAGTATDFIENDAILFDDRVNSGTASFSGTVNLSSGNVMPFSVTFNNSGSVSYTIAGNAAITGFASLTLNGSGRVTLLNNNTYTGLTSINAGTLSEGVNNALGTANVTVNGGVFNLTGHSDSVGVVTLTSGTIVGGSLTSTAGFNVASGSISTVLAGSATLTQSTAGGSVTLAAANTYTGLTTVSAGTLTEGVNNAIAAGSVTICGGVLNLTGHSDSVGVVTLTGGAIAGGTLTTTTGTFTLAAGSVSSVLAGSSFLRKSGNGNVVLAAANAYTGITYVDGGTLTYGVDNAIASGPMFVRGGVLDLSGHTDSVGGLIVTNGGTVTGGVLASTAGFLIGDGYVSTALAGATTLSKSSATMVTLAGANTYTGATYVSAGTLVLGSLGSIVSSSSVSVRSGAVLDVSAKNGWSLGSSQTLTGAGTVLGSVVAVLGSHIAPGSDVGTLTLSGDLTLSSGVKLDFELGDVAASDMISMIGSTLSFDNLGFSDFTFTAIDGFGEGGVYTLISAGSISGSLLEADLTGTIGGKDAALYVSGNQLLLNVVPEPATWWLLTVAGLAWLARGARRRRIRFLPRGH
jgi:autotransporter-associated beta strand protein